MGGALESDINGKDKRGIKRRVTIALFVSPIGMHLQPKVVSGSYRLVRGWRGERIFEGEEMVVMVVREGWGCEVLEKLSDCDKFLKILIIFAVNFKKLDLIFMFHGAKRDW